MKAFRNPSNPATARRLLGGLVVLAIAGCAVDSPTAPDPWAADHGAGAINTFSSRPIDPLRTVSMLAKAQGQVRPGSVVQSEPRLGVPTFLWTRGKPSKTSPASALAAGAAHPEVDAARAVLADHAALYGLADTDVAGASVVSVHDQGTGPILVKLRTELAGIEIFGEQLSVIMNRKLESVAISGYLTSAATPPAQPGGLAFGLSAPAAALAAVNLLAGTTVDPSLVVAAGTRDGYDLFGLAPAAGVPLDEPVRLKRVYFHRPDGLEAAYYVEVSARTGAPPSDTVSIDGSPLATTASYAYVVSAATGQLLFRKNLTVDAAGSAPHESNLLAPGGFTYRVWADATTGIPLDTPAGNAVHPKVVAAPDGAQAAFVAPSDVTLPNFPFSMNDPWLAPGATQTLGNNVDAYLNVFSPDGIGTPTTTPGSPATSDYRAQITGTDAFLHAQVPEGDTSSTEGRQGALQQLFYNINFMHDWYYDAGFNEAAGNAQTNNFGRGGTGNDPINAQLQDFSGFNNANMTTPADGARPTMRMYVFASAANMLEIQAPAAIAGKNGIGLAISGPQAYDLTLDIVKATFANSPSACTVTNAAALAGKIGMFDFDSNDGTGCSFSTRASRITTTTSATAVLMVSGIASPNSITSLTNFVASLTKPIATISWNTGQAIKGQLSLPATVTARLLRAPDRDGAIDNQIVAHEWFHYASNRLISNAAGLNSTMSSGMGEGWSDFNALMLTVRQDDTQTPSNASFDGAYALATFATSGVPFNGSQNDGYYFGIRRYPYSTDMTKNPLTFKHISDNVALPAGPPVAFGASGATNSEVHNTGEVWTTMLWECYAALLRDTLGATPRLTFQHAQDRMKQYLIAALKVTPPSPTFTEARDALLAVSYASDPTDYVAFRFAFAKRGAGVHAVSPDRFAAGNAGVVEDFSAGADLSFDSATLDDALGSCDGDGVVDHGEYGRITVTLRNTGTVTLVQTTATITSASPDVWYPAGHVVGFPAMAPGATGSASLRVAYLGTVTGVQQLDFHIDYTDDQVTGGPGSKDVGFRTNTDEIAASSPSDDVEQATPPWTASFNPVLGNPAPWRRLEITPLSHAWHVDDPHTGSDQYLASPTFTVDGSGSVTVQFDHSWGFEFDGGGNYDGGVVEMSTNGGAFTDIGVGYTGTILNYSGDINPLKGRQGYVQTSGGTVHTSITRAVAPGSAVVIRFRAGSDGGVGAAGWNIDNIAFTGVVETPFATVVADGHSCAIVPTSADLGITVDDGVTTVTAGDSVTYTITATNNGGDDILGATVADAFPGGLACTWTCAGNVNGACSAAGSGNIADRVALPAGGSVTYTASCAASTSTASTLLVNTATVALPGPVSDPSPGNNAATDTDVLLRLPAHVFASKTVAGSFVKDGTVTYTIVLTNDGIGKQFDNAGDELVDVLPAGLALVDATASTGNAVATLGDNTVRWNGTIDPSISVTVTIDATITADAGATISNQASIRYENDGTATNNATGTTDAYVCAAPDPGLAR